MLTLEVDAGIEVLGARGVLAAADVPVLAQVIAEALQVQPRALVLDLLEAWPVAPEIVEMVVQAARSARGWPHPSLVVCTPVGPLSDALAGVTSVHQDRASALAHVDDRAPHDRERIVLDFSPHAPGAARRAVLEWATRRGLGGPVVEDMALVVSELVTNAVLHAAPKVILEVELGEHEVVLAVEDGTPAAPTLRVATNSSEGGRGMMLVEMLSSEHGVRPRPPGKTVWASLNRAPWEARTGQSS